MRGKSYEADQQRSLEARRYYSDKLNGEGQQGDKADNAQQYFPCNDLC